MFENKIIRKTDICSCGRKFIIQDIEKLERINDPKFMQGVVRHFSKATCPECNKKVELLLKQIGQTYAVIGIVEEINDKNVKNDTENTIKNVETTENEVKIENKEVSNLSNELICLHCGKELKSKAGLRSHLRTHEK